ncbi:MAG: methyltransferase domain-containing protein [Planctomycetes bacterium]|jgi:SAM-dependent methyltransferase|nr:methyltransferase domain-containing protein [Planctomycetota bacterium]
MEPDAIERAKVFWEGAHAAAEHELHDNIFRHPMVQAYASLQAYGSLVGQLDALTVAIRERTRPGDEILTVCCGPALKERVIARALPDRRFVGIDIADGVVTKASAEIAAAGIANLTVEVGDANHLQLRQDRFACVLGLGAVHHLQNLENFWQQCRRGLRVGGSLIAEEYVGPSRFQWTEAQIHEGDRVLREIVPAEHQGHHTSIRRIPIESMLRADPSEAVRSAEILATCRASGLTVTAVVGVGCSLLQPVLMHQIASFDPRNWDHNLVLSRLFAEEQRLLRAGVLDHDFAILVAVKGS